jgi:hypothetical protein
MVPEEGPKVKGWCAGTATFRRRSSEQVVRR